MYFLLIQTLSLHPTLGDKINVSNGVLSHSIDFETQGILVLDEILFGVFPNRVDKNHAYYAIYYNCRCSSSSCLFIYDYDSMYKFRTCIHLGVKSKHEMFVTEARKLHQHAHVIVVIYVAAGLTLWTLGRQRRHRSSIPARQSAQRDSIAPTPSQPQPACCALWPVCGPLAREMRRYVKLDPMD